MTDLRISSEPDVETSQLQRFLPPVVRRAVAADSDTDVDLQPITRAMVRALSQLFGMMVNASPGQPPPGADGAPPPRVSTSFACALATLQLGGDIEQPVEILPASLAVVRQTQVITAVLDDIAADSWPPACRAAGLDFDVSVGVIMGHVRLLAPAAAAVEPPPSPAVPGLAARLLALPMRLRVELSAMPVAVRTLLPLRPGTVLPIDPRRLMALVMGDHAIGEVTLTPMPDGRQEAEIISIALAVLEGKP
ncbi:MAG: hypothetical protein ACOYKQ_02230 [Polymorphobacter sp.]